MPDHRLVQKALDSLLRGNIYTALDALTEFMNSSEGITVSEARARLKHDYYQDVNQLAEVLANEWKGGDFDGSRTSFEEAIDGAVCGARRVQDMYEMQECLTYTRNIQAADEISDNSSAIYQCFRADVVDELRKAFDIRTDQRPPSLGQIECEECGTWSEGYGTVCNDCRETENGLPPP